MQLHITPNLVQAQTTRQPPPANAKLSSAYGMWTPSQFDTCPKSLHDTYWVYGPDDTVYPTWHPSSDVNPATGQTCTYGHEHGRNPAESRLASWTVPFGYVNEEFARTNSGKTRHEDHVGHKIEFKNDVTVGLPGGGTGPVCQILTKLHQGTHSADAFTNNMHELFYYVSCNNGVQMRWRGMHLFGAAGGFEGTCEGFHNVGTFTPDTSPTLENESLRRIPDKGCLTEAIEQAKQQPYYASDAYYSNYREDWSTGFRHGLYKNGDQYLDHWGQVGFDKGYTKLFNIDSGAYFKVMGPSRYFEPTKPNNLGRRIDMCFIPELAALQGDCINVNNLIKQGIPVTWDHPRSPFKGTYRTVHFDWVTISNNTSNEKWYSNAAGTVIRPQPDASQGITIEQIISRTPFAMYYFGNRESDFNGRGVHAPN
ncbi:hypothetical protein WKK05_18610 [Nostoc sp. UHCC 0302]|uniref:hypothetical protein n=1 Tax=Nostoc sp. UHCC 0302 TaxID=3134896 RepID=UPI00311CC594